MKKLIWNKPPMKSRFKTHSTVERNANGNKILKFDFMTITEKRDNGYFLIGSNKLLVSPSMLNYQITRKMLAPIPSDVLEKRRAIGANLMVNLETVFKQKIYDTTQLFMPEQDRKYLNNFLDWLALHQIKVKAVEKFITNGETCGIVDLIVLWNGCLCILEIKTRNKKELRFTDYVQAAMYRNMTNLPTYVVMIDDKGSVEYVAISPSKSFEMYGEYSNFLRMWKRYGVLESEKIQPIKID